VVLFSAQKVKATGFSEKSLNLYQTTWCYILEDSTFPSLWSFVIEQYIKIIITLPIAVEGQVSVVSIAICWQVDDLAFKP
jgi:hypothetical protein